MELRGGGTEGFLVWNWGGCVELRGFWCGTEGVVLNWGIFDVELRDFRSWKGAEKALLCGTDVLNWGGCGTEGDPSEVNYDSFCVGWVFFNFLHRFLEGVFLVFNPWSSLRHFGHTYLSGTLFFLILAQVRWTQTVHSSHSIIGRPAKGPPQKHVTEYQDASSRLKCILKQ